MGIPLNGRGANFSDQGIARGGTIDGYLTNSAGEWILVRGTASNISGQTGASYAYGCLALATDTGLVYYNTGGATTASFTAVNAGAAALTIPNSLTDSSTTNGNSFRILTTAGTFTTGGAAIKADLAAGTAGNGLVAITTGDYSGTGLLLVSGVASTAGTLARITATGLTTGNALYISAVTATLTSGKYINCYNGSASDFTVGKYGAVVIAGTASTSVLTLTAGNAVITSGNLTLTSGNAVLTSGNLTLTSGTITLTANNSVITCTGTGANGMLLTNLANSANTTVSGTAKTVEIMIGATPYYFLVYPTTSA